MLALLLTGCGPSDDTLRLAAASVAVSAGSAGLAAQDGHDTVVGETDTFAITDDCVGDCGTLLPDWTGTLTVALTWGGDAAGACACGRHCTSSAWTAHATGDLHVYDRLQGGMGDSGDPPDHANVEELDVAVDLTGTVQLDLRADIEEGCELAPGTVVGNRYTGTLDPRRGPPAEVEVSYENTWEDGWIFEVTLDGETTRWEYI